VDEPDAVCVATDRYRSDADVVGRFIDAECHTGGAQSAATTKVLYARFQCWAANEGCDELSKVAFGRALTDKGYPVDQGTHDRLRRRICLHDREDESAGR